MTENTTRRSTLAQLAAKNLVSRASGSHSTAGLKLDALKQHELNKDSAAKGELLDKEQFLSLLQTNFDRLDRDGSQGISRAEIEHAMHNISEFNANESIMLVLLMRYFDFISELVEEQADGEKVITRADVETLAQFLLHSDMTLETLCKWCTKGG